MSSKAGYIFHSDPQWVDFHLSHSVGGRVGYCRGAGAPTKNVERGGKLCFMRKGDKRKQIYFWANFVSADPVSIDDAWAGYGTALGAESEDDWMGLVSRLPSVSNHGSLIVILGDRMTAPDAPLSLSQVGVKEVMRATKGWSIEAEEVRRIVGGGPGTLALLPDQDLEEFEGSEEGRRRLRTHLQIERNRTLVKRAKERWEAEDPWLRCVCCQVSFREKYGFSFIEAHHKVPLSQLANGEQTVTRIEDMAPVCANCHRALHLSQLQTTEALLNRLSASADWHG